MTLDYKLNKFGETFVTKSETGNINVPYRNTRQLVIYDIMR